MAGTRNHSRDWKVYFGEIQKSWEFYIFRFLILGLVFFGRIYQLQDILQQNTFNKEVFLQLWVPAGLVRMWCSWSVMAALEAWWNSFYNNSGVYLLRIPERDFLSWLEEMDKNLWKFVKKMHFVGVQEKKILVSGRGRGFTTLRWFGGGLSWFVIKTIAFHNFHVDWPFRSHHSFWSFNKEKEAFGSVHLQLVYYHKGWSFQVHFFYDSNQSFWDLSET